MFCVLVLFRFVVCIHFLLFYFLIFGGFLFHLLAESFLEQKCLIFSKARSVSASVGRWDFG